MLTAIFNFGNAALKAKVVSVAGSGEAELGLVPANEAKIL